MAILSLVLLLTPQEMALNYSRETNEQYYR
jgi:hypothetical protein